MRIGIFGFEFLGAARKVDRFEVAALTGFQNLSALDSFPLHKNSNIRFIYNSGSERIGMLFFIYVCIPVQRMHGQSFY